MKRVKSSWLILFLSALGLSACASTRPSSSKLSDAEKLDLELRMAEGAIRENDPIGALHALKRADEHTSSKTDRGRVAHIRALAFAAKKEPGPALDSAKKAAELLPQSPEIQNNLGRMLLDAGRPSEAEPWLKKSAVNQLYRDAYVANTNLGVLYFRRGDDTLAAQHLNKAIEQNPAGACHAYYYLGHIDLKRNRFNDATKNYDRATQRFCASFVDAHLALAIAYERGKQYDKARRKFLEIRDGFPNTVASDQAMERLQKLP